MVDIKKFDNKFIGLNCGNCPNYSTTSHPILSTDLHYCGKERISKYQKQCTEHKGCASHPMALQVLSTPVVVELEENKLLAHKRMNAYLDLGNDGNWQGGKEEGLEEAIKLLKGSA